MSGFSPGVKSNVRVLFLGILFDIVLGTTDLKLEKSSLDLNFLGIAQIGFQNPRVRLNLLGSAIG